MNISSEIFPIDGSNSSSYLFNNSTEMKNNFLYFLNVLLVLPIDSYVIWLIVRGNGLKAELFILNHSVFDIILSVESVFIFLSYEFTFLWTVVELLDAVAIIGHPLFQCMICVERYLAVVHPVTFLKFKPLRYRVICSVIIWMVSFGSGGIIVLFLILKHMLYIVFLVAQFFLFFSVELFCCAAVLRALKQPGPGERGREREEGNNIQRRAFCHLLITTGAMLIFYAPYTILLCLYITTDGHNTLLWIFSSFFFTVSGLVQPLFFLYRMGKLPFIKYISCSSEKWC